MAGFDVAGARVVVAGAALSGVAAAELLVRRGARVVLSDAKPSIAPAERLRAAGVVLELGGHVEATFAGADLVVLSPGVPVDQPAVDAARRAGVAVVSEIELASRWLTGRVVAITGTKGKSTTTTLVGRMLEAGGLEAIVGGNIGVPVSSQVDRTGPEVVHVIEASSFQLEAIETFRPHVAVLLNFSPDHLDRHRTLEAYGAAKARVFENQQPGDWALVNADDEAARRLAAGARARHVEFTMAGAAGVRFAFDGEWIVERIGEVETKLVPRGAIRLVGRHLVADVVAAAGVGRLFGVAPHDIERAVAGFAGLEHALEVRRRGRGSRLRERLEGDQRGRRGAIGRELRRGRRRHRGRAVQGGDLRRLRAPLAARGAAVVAIGEARPLVREALAGVVAVHEADSMRAAVERAWRLAPPGGVVLLAPACASFDMFHDYAERGRVFKAEVARLGAARGRRNREQSSVRPGGREPVAGNAGCPGLRDRCLDPRSADDC